MLLNILLVLPATFNPIAHHVTGPTTGGGNVGGVHCALIVTVAAAVSTAHVKHNCEPSVPPLFKHTLPADTASGRKRRALARI